MQKLVFESAWDKTIAPVDREKIIQCFEETIEQTDEGQGIIFTPIRTAFNYEHSLLVTVLIHNFTQQAYPIANWLVTYYEDEIEIASLRFSFSHVTIGGNTSMPWTFIFPLKSQKQKPKVRNAALVLENYREIQ